MYLEKIIKQDYKNNGYAIIHGVIEPDLVEEVQKHVEWLQNKYPKIRPEAFHHDLLVNDPFIHKLLNNQNMLDIVEMIIGPNIALFGAHYIAKRPKDGKPVGWHQDGSYWPLEPMNVVSVWLAGTESLKKNGCKEFKDKRKKWKNKSFKDGFIKGYESGMIDCIKIMKANQANQ